MGDEVQQIKDKIDVAELVGGIRPAKAVWGE